MATTALRGTPVSTSGELPDVGDHAPEFTLTSTSLADVSSEGLVGSRVVLNIFPSVDTGVCAASVRRFNELAGSLTTRRWSTCHSTYRSL
jgi:thiol peroxidase